MRKLYFLLFFITFSGFACTGPVIQNPAPLVACDGNGDGVEAFDLSTVIGEVLGGLDPGLYTTTFYNSLVNANNGISPIIPINAYIGNYGEIIYIRVEENANPANFSTTTLELRVQTMPTASINGPSTICGGEEISLAFQGSLGGEPYTFTYAINGGAAIVAQSTSFNALGISLPIITSGAYDVVLISVGASEGCVTTLNLLHHIDVFAPPTPLQPLDLSIEQIPFTGSAVFDLTTNNGLLLNGDPNVTITYYPTLTDAQINANVISNPDNFTGTNGQEIGVRVTNNLTGCAAIKSFRLFITNPDIIFIPDTHFKAKLLSANGGNLIAQNDTGPIVIDTNSDGEIELSEALAVTYLDVQYSQIQSVIGVNSFVNLKDFRCFHNELTQLDLTGLDNLERLMCDTNHITSLDLSNLIHLKDFSCASNQISSLDLSMLNNLQYLGVQNNLLTSLSVNNLIGLIDLHINSNQIATIDISNLTNLLTFDCRWNPLTTLNLDGLSNIQNLECGVNQFTSLDVSSLTNLQLFWCFNEPLLTNLIIKNGSDESNLILTGNPNLQFICADESQVGSVQSYLDSIGNTTTVVSSYCTFTPGGNYNTITGTMTFDANNNGCDASDDIQSNIRVNINDGTNTGASFTNNSGNYTFYTQAGSFDVTPSVENQTWFNFLPVTVTIPFADNNNNTVSQNFCITANGVHPDVEVIVAPITLARPGFDAEYKVVYKNKGNQLLSGNISFSYDDTVLDFVNSDIVPTVQSAGLLSYDYTDLLPFENRSFTIKLHVNSPTDSPAVNIGDVFHFSASINPIAGDETPSDNTFQFNQTVVGSFDPNDITCMEGNIVPPAEIGNYLHYIINFENTGTADAENIVVRDVIDTTQFDVNSLQVLNSSDAVQAKLTGNVAEFIFQNINLHSGGHGNILIKIKSKNTLIAGSTVSKKANIYFDYNAPIDTNLENTIFQQLSNPDFEDDASISVFPNPTKGNININCDNTIKSVQLYDVQGRLLQTGLINENKTIFDISNQSNGVYFIKIISDKGIGVKRIVKE